MVPSLKPFSAFPAKKCLVGASSGHARPSLRVAAIGEGAHQGRWSREVLGALTATVITVGMPLAALADITPVYFGNGCFWGRQKDFVDTELSLGRPMAEASAVVGYAGGQRNPSTTCYYYNSPDSVYEKQGHAEVVQVKLTASEAEKEFGMFAETYFKQFQKTAFGMIRLDPQDRGPGYRNVIGLPGGVDSPLFKVLQSKNKNNMNLVPGEGNSFVGGKPTEDDAINTVYVVDSTALPFHQAEAYHQYHDGIGKRFPAEYTRDLKQAKMKDGTIGNIPGCMEYPM